MKRSSSRTARIFLSSTFRDFGEERDLLVRKVFPGLRTRLKDRFVELVDVDLRWGITAEQAERGEVLPICLAEIDRSRPFFVGLLGERYGWIPPADGYPAHMLEGQPWLEAHRGGKSVTELEILHGVLNDPKMAGRALFYFRSAGYAERKGGDYVPASAEDARRQSELKQRVRGSGFPVVEDYADPAALAERLEADLWTVLDETFPAAEVPDALARETMRHEAYAAPRRGLYLGGEAYLKALDEALASGQQWILIGGQSGGGKSALIANWTEALGKSHVDLVLHVHYLGATADASDPVSLVRRLVEAIRRAVGSEEEVPGDPEKLLEALPLWLANASSWAGLKGRRFVIVVDALNGLTDRRDLRWFPSFLPERVHLVVSGLPGEVQDHLREKAEWTEVAVRPLDRKKAEELFVAYLRRFNKELPPGFVSRIMDHELVANPLFLSTLAEELRLFGVHERLGDRLEHYLTSRTVDDLFERVLERVEEDNGADTVRKVMVGLWASRAGLTEEEIRAWADLRPAEWAYIRNALGNALLEGSGRIVFGHDYLRIAVSDRYLQGNNTLPDEGQSPEAIEQRHAAHSELARWFEGHAFQPEGTPGFHVSDARAAEEIPHQWREARDWERLKASLTTRQMFEALYNYCENEDILSYWLDLEREAEAEIEKDLESAWEVWGPNEAVENIGDLASRLQQFLSFAGRYKEFTLRLGRLSLAITEKALGPEHPATGTRLNNLALLLQNKGDYDAAEPLLRRALAIAEKTLGRGHLETGAIISNLAFLLFAKRDYDAAELLRRALTIALNADGADVRRGLPPGHQLKYLSHFALLLWSDHKKSHNTVERLRRELVIAEKTVGPDNRETGVILNTLAGVLAHGGERDNPSAKQREAGYLEAEAHLRRALAISEKALGPDHLDTGTCLNNLAMLLDDRGDYDAAKPLYHRALAIRERNLEPDNALSGTYLKNLASFAWTMKISVAEPLYRLALAIAEKAKGPENLETSQYLENLAQIRMYRHDYNTAERLYRRALSIRDKILGPKHPATGEILNNLALLLQEEGEYDAAETLLRRALAIAEKAQGPEHLETGERLNNLALLLFEVGDCAAADLFDAKGNYNAAEPLLRRALAIREKVLGSKHGDTLSTLHKLGQVLGKLGKTDEANLCFRSWREALTSHRDAFHRSG